MGEWYYAVGARGLAGSRVRGSGCRSRIRARRFGLSDRERFLTSAVAADGGSTTCEGCVADSREPRRSRRMADWEDVYGQSDQELPGPGCVASRRWTLTELTYSAVKSASADRAVRAELTDAAGGGVGAVEHRRGTGERRRRPLHPSPAELRCGSLGELSTQVEIARRLSLLPSDAASAVSRSISPAPARCSTVCCGRASKDDA